MTSQLGGSAHKRGLVNPDTGRIVLYTYRDITLTFTVKVSVNNINTIYEWIYISFAFCCGSGGMISSETGAVVDPKCILLRIQFQLKIGSTSF